MIVNDTRINIDRQQSGERQLRIQGNVFGYVIPLSLEQLNELIGELIHEATPWRHSLRPDHYKTLGVDRTASTDDIKKAYRTLAKRYHPDGQVGDEARLKTINEAYAVLSDHEKRTQYEQSIL